MAVYTEVAAEDLDVLLERYEIGGLAALKGIAGGVENSNFFLETDRGQFILTLYEKRVSPDDLPFFIGLMDHLAARGVICPTPVHDREGRALQTLAGRPAAIVTFLTGYELRKPLPNHCFALGAALASLHLAGLDFPLKRPNVLSLSGWSRLFATIGEDGDQLASGMTATIAKELQDLSRVLAAELASWGYSRRSFPG